MTPSERRAALIQQIDQQIAEAKCLASDPLLWPEERAFAEVQLAVRLDAVNRVEKLLASA